MARKRSRRGRSPAWVGLLAVGVLAVGAFVYDSRQAGTPALVTGNCTTGDGAVTLTPEMAANAATIAAVARSRGLPERATVIALATAQQESRLRNLDYGDRDSLGLFQQRPSQGWGTAEQVQDPVYAAAQFFDGLVEVPDRQTGRLTDVAQAVQRSGFPEAYQQWEGMAQSLATALLADAPAQLTCSLGTPVLTTDVATRTASAAELTRREAGPAQIQQDAVIAVPGEGWPAATWAVAHAAELQLDELRYAGWRWSRTDGWAEQPDDDKNMNGNDTDTDTTDPNSTGVLTLRLATG